LSCCRPRRPASFGVFMGLVQFFVGPLVQIFIGGGHEKRP
jgi:hypothetical protein